LSWYQAKLDKLKIQLHEQMKNFENSSDLIIATISKEVKKAESSLQKLYREIEHKNINL